MDAKGADSVAQEDASGRPFVKDSVGRSMSLESGEEFQRTHEQQHMYTMMPPSPHAPQRVSHDMGNNTGYPLRFSHARGRLPTRNIRSVVTDSFSVEDEREDPSRAHRRGNHHTERRGDKEEVARDEGEREGWVPSAPRGHATSYPMPPTPSPKASHHQRQYIQRAYSSSGYFHPPPDSRKRSYYHHAAPPANQYQSHLPPDFMPPTKRSRMEPQRKEIMVSPRHHHDQHHHNMMHRAQTFPSPPPSWHHPHANHSPHHLPPSPHAHGGSQMLVRDGYHRPASFDNGFPQVSPGSDIEDSPRSWTGSVWTPSPHHRSSQFWESPRHGKPMPSPHGSYPQLDGRGFGTDNAGTGDKMKLMVDAAAAAADNGRRDHANDNATTPEKPLMLLSLPQDRVSLSETLCVVRENIEVFTATKRDVDAPAPGRKHAVVVGQVGLRCIHCRHTTRCSDRVKRAVCYPSSIKRIYRTVIDMKLDHFTQCKYVPIALKNRLDELKAIHTRSTGTTMQYFIHAAHSLGMEDGKNGVALRESVVPMNQHPTPPLPPKVQQNRPKVLPKPINGSSVARCDSMSSGSWMSGSTPRIDSMSSGSFEASGNTAPHTGEAGGNFFEGSIPLALPEDKTALSPLRCFLREQVCAFSATERDIAVRAPTTFSISVGQVGIGCIHCVKQTANHRSNRAVCFPFSIGRIYQSVADIQRFHFGECKMMPPDVKEKFLELQSASSKGSKGLATRQYWVTSAKKIGLVDTQQGIRFGRDPSKPEASPSFSLDILAQAAFSVTTASKRLVLPEDKPCIAEFLYVVMEQLQPCRFTEADRNKRRLKDVGCIGVECKHCAGQVDSRKFFWSSVSAVESNFVSVHTHMLECKSVPQALKDKIVELKKLRKEQTAALRTGSQKAFFARVWKRLHDEEGVHAKQKQQKNSTQPRATQSHATQPHDTKPHDTKPHGTQPPGTQPHDTQHHDTQSHDTQPHDTQSHGTQPPDTQSQDTQPRDTQPREEPSPTNSYDDAMPTQSVSV